MINRYTKERMGFIWSDQNRYQKWLEVELAVCDAWYKLGKIPHEALFEIKKKASFSVDRIEEIEKTVKHDVIAFLTTVSEYVGDLSRYIHLGLTSYDVVDTAFSLLLRDSIDEILSVLKSLKSTILKEALEHKKTIMVGRTHGVHAEPITFGIKLLVWYEEVKRNIKRITQARENISFGRIAGAVGTYIHLNPEVERLALNELGLKPAPVSTQILQRDRHAEVLAALAITASSLDKFALEIRHLQKTETLELEEPFTKGQKGSSAMPHKRNPVRTERISGLARIARSNLQAALENIPLWHERDISHSSTERIIFPDTFILLDFILTEINDIIKNWHVYPERMRKNVYLTQGLVFSQRALLKLTEKNLSRETAYELVQKNSLKAWQEEKDFKELLISDPEISKHLSSKEIDDCFTLEPYLAQIDFIFNRILSDES